MAQVIALEDLKDARVGRDLPEGHRAWRTDIIFRPRQGPDGPVAFLAESSPHRVLRTHYHQCDQFQVIALGGGTLGRHDLKLGGVHFARAFTPYGPIVNGAEGIGFITLRARRDPGQPNQFLPEHTEQLKSVKHRAPWQVSEMSAPRSTADGKDASIVPFEYIRDDRGLAAYTVTLKANAAVTAPAPSSVGQYIVVTRGSLLHGGQEKDGQTVIWVGGNEPPFELRAGAQGLEAIVLNFPREVTAPEKPQPRPNAELKVWQCVLCAFVYDEAAGMPDYGIAPGTRWADVPESFGCPDCDAKKSDFEMVEI